MKSFALLIIALLGSFVGAQEKDEAAETSAPTTEDRWGGCQAVFDGASVETLEKIEIGKQTIVCFHVGNTKDWARGVDYIRLSYLPEADQYSRLYIPNCKFRLEHYPPDYEHASHRVTYLSFETP